MLCEGVPYPTRRALDTRAFRRCVAGSPARRSPCMLRWSKSLSGRLVTQPLRRRPCSSVHGTSTSFGGLSPGLAGASVPSSSSHMMYSTSILGNQSAGNRHAVCNRPNFSNGLEGRTGRHFSAASGSPSEEPSSPPKKTELKKKKSAAGGDASTDAPTLAPGSPVAESKPSLTTRAAALARKGLIDFPILAASKTYEFFRLMIQGGRVTRVSHLCFPLRGPPSWLQAPSSLNYV